MNLRRAGEELVPGHQVQNIVEQPSARIEYPFIFVCYNEARRVSSRLANSDVVPHAVAQHRVRQHPLFAEATKREIY